MAQEIWVSIRGYEGLYEISNSGKVKSVETTSGYRKKEKILRSGIEGSGYAFVFLCKNGVPKKFTIHRMVGKHFIPNPENKSCINHLDGNKLNNNDWNLEWATYSENEKHAYDTHLKFAPLTGKFGKLHKMSKPIIQITLDGSFIKLFDNALHVERELGFSSRNVGACARGKIKTAYKYKWQFN